MDNSHSRFILGEVFIFGLYYLNKGDHFQKRRRAWPGFKKSSFLGLLVVEAFQEQVFRSKTGISLVCLFSDIPPACFINVISFWEFLFVFIIGFWNKNPVKDTSMYFHFRKEYFFLTARVLWSRSLWQLVLSRVRVRSRYCLVFGLPLQVVTLSKPLVAVTSFSS